MWRRSIGIMMVVGASWLFYQTTPQANRAQAPLAHVPLPISEHATTPFHVPFTVNEGGRYQVAISYRYTAVSGQDSNKPFAEPQFLCEFWDTGPVPASEGSGIVAAGNYQPTAFIRQSAFLRPSPMTVRYDSGGRTYLLEPMRLEAGHTYNASILTLCGQELLQGRQPCIRVQRAPRQPWHDNYVRTIAIFNCSLLGLMGLLLTFWGGSRIPLRKRRES